MNSEKKKTNNVRKEKGIAKYNILQTTFSKTLKRFQLESTIIEKKVLKENKEFFAELIF